MPDFRREPSSLCNDSIKNEHPRAGHSLQDPFTMFTSLGILPLDTHTHTLLLHTGLWIMLGTCTLMINPVKSLLESTAHTTGKGKVYQIFMCKTDLREGRIPLWSKKARKEP